MLERWRKLVWNIPFNGLSVAAGGIDTAAILADDGLRQLALDLMDETIAIANACGHNLPTALALEQMKQTRMMGNFKPSTLIDYLAGRPLEIEPIWGETLRRGQAKGVEAPQLARLYRDLTALDPSGAKMKTARLPQISVFNRQRKTAVDRTALEDFARRALPLCARERGSGLTSLTEIDVLLISDRKIDELHRRFMGITGPTDVITFQHGEICISVETAQRQAATHGTSLEHELRLYLVHGLLHLHGFDDRERGRATPDASVQEKSSRQSVSAIRAGELGSCREAFC